MYVEIIMSRYVEITSGFLWVRLTGNNRNPTQMTRRTDSLFYEFTLWLMKWYGKITFLATLWECTEQKTCWVFQSTLFPKSQFCFVKALAHQNVGGRFWLFCELSKDRFVFCFCFVEKEDADLKMREYFLWNSGCIFVRIYTELWNRSNPQPRTKKHFCFSWTLENTQPCHILGLKRLQLEEKHKYLNTEEKSLKTRCGSCRVL